ncbi:uncharacterized protein EI97DRAFT_459302 [Westerdykella ornata]|uniref:Uncharacterized protein n=1 Tax=Westerdykella ornata TaxID=318751 RepID=A0A6A6JG54_WESOR|nr:uncharacterized protein EI97DRAFT_459302 [Westerdykella ornata]KAF2275392.1 hypothetical protein EI97DRAFT_459302 [Westerdykella ornata]
MSPPTTIHITLDTTPTPSSPSNAHNCPPLFTAGPLDLNKCDAYCLLFVLLVPFILLWLSHQSNLLNEKSHQTTEDETALRPVWASATTHAQLLGLVEQYVYRRISWGPWDAGSLRDRWPEKRFLKRLMRGGVIPIEISEGGLQTYLKRGRSDTWWDVLLPTYAQSKGRGFFVFVMPYPVAPFHAFKKAFLTNLLAQDEYAVTVSYHRSGGWYSHSRYSPMKASDEYLEAGALSRFGLLLPFMQDRVLKEGRLVRKDRVIGRHGGIDRAVTLEDFMSEEPGEAVPLLVSRPFVVVRVEALDHTPVRLDEFVYQEARDAGFIDVFMEDELSRAVGGLYDEHGIRWKTGV